MHSHRKAAPFKHRGIQVSRFIDIVYERIPIIFPISSGKQFIVDKIKNKIFKKFFGSLCSFATCI